MTLDLLAFFFKKPNADADAIASRNTQACSSSRVCVLLLFLPQFLGMLCILFFQENASMNRAQTGTDTVVSSRVSVHQSTLTGAPRTRTLGRGPGALGPGPRGANDRTRARAVFRGVRTFSRQLRNLLLSICYRFSSDNEFTDRYRYRCSMFTNAIDLAPGIDNEFSIDIDTI